MPLHSPDAESRHAEPQRVVYECPVCGAIQVLAGASDRPPYCLNGEHEQIEMVQMRT